MKYIFTILLTMILGVTQAQLRTQDSTNYEYQDYYSEQFIEDQYKYEKQNLIWGVVGSGAMFLGNTINYYRYGQPGYLYIGGMSLTANIYSVTKLIYLRRKIKKIDR